MGKVSNFKSQVSNLNFGQTKCWKVVICQKKKKNKIGNLFFEVKRDWIWEKNNKKITLKNDRYMDVQNINKKIYEIGFIIYSDLKI